MRGFFISGTDTDVGKTVVSAILAVHSSRIFPSVHYHKPVQTGHDSDVQTVKNLVGLAKNITCTQGLSFHRPLSPHIAAHLEQAHIDFAKLVESTRDAARAEFNIVEGAGGLKVPLNHNRLMIDLIKALAQPCVLVARSTLGTINHTLLSIDALRARHIPIFGVVMVGDRNLANEHAIQYYGKIANILVVPKLMQVTHTEVAHLVQKNHHQLDRFFHEAKS